MVFCTSRKNRAAIITSDNELFIIKIRVERRKYPLLSRILCADDKNSCIQLPEYQSCTYDEPQILISSIIQKMLWLINRIRKWRGPILVFHHGYFVLVKPARNSRLGHTQRMASKRPYPQNDFVSSRSVAKRLKNRCRSQKKLALIRYRVSSITVWKEVMPVKLVLIMPARNYRVISYAPLSRNFLLWV